MKISGDMIKQMSKILICILTFGSFVAFILVIQKNLDRFYESADPDVQMTGSSLASMLSLIPVTMILPIMGIVFVGVSQVTAFFAIVFGIALFVISTLGVGIWMIRLANNPTYDEQKHILRSAASMIFIFYILFAICLVFLIQWLIRLAKNAFTGMKIPWSLLGKPLLCLVTIGSFAAFVSVVQQNMDTLMMSPNPEIRKKGSIMNSLVSMLPISMMMPILGLVFLKVSKPMAIVLLVIGIIMFITSTLGLGIQSLVWANDPEMAEHKHLLNSIGAMILIFYILFVICAILTAHTLNNANKKIQDFAKEHEGEIKEVSQAIANTSAGKNAIQNINNQHPGVFGRGHQKSTFT